MKQEQPSETIVRAVATWWADRISNPKFDAGSGPGCEAVSMAGGMAALLVKPVQAEQRTKFIEAFVRTALAKDDRGYYHNSAGTDYGPDKFLADAMIEAGIPTDNAPWKSHSSWYSNDGFGTQYGYCAGWEYHYLMPDGRFVVGEISGGQARALVEKIVAVSPDDISPLRWEVFA